MELCAAQQQYAPKKAPVVFGGASGAQISATITSIQAQPPPAPGFTPYKHTVIQAKAC